MANIDELRKQYPAYADLSDGEIISHIAENNGVPVDYVAGYFGVKRNAPGFTSSLKQGLGMNVEGLGRVIDDTTDGKPGAITRFGRGVQFNNPSSEASQSLDGFLKHPVQGAAEFIGQAAGSTAPALVMSAIPGVGEAVAPNMVRGLALRGLQAANGVVPQALVASAPAYGQIRNDQEAAGMGDAPGAKARAALAALGTGAVEVAGGAQATLRRAASSNTRRELVGEFADSPLKTFRNQLGRSALEEGGEEIVQQPMQQLGAYQDPTTEASLRDTAWSGFGGLVGGLGIGSAGSARMAQQHAKINRYREANLLDAPLSVQADQAQWEREFKNKAGEDGNAWYNERMNGVNDAAFASVAREADQRGMDNAHAQVGVGYTPDMFGEAPSNPIPTTSTEEQESLYGNPGKRQMSLDFDPMQRPDVLYGNQDIPYVESFNNNREGKFNKELNSRATPSPMTGVFSQLPISGSLTRQDVARATPAVEDHVGRPAFPIPTDVGSAVATIQQAVKQNTPILDGSAQHTAMQHAVRILAENGIDPKTVVSAAPAKNAQQATQPVASAKDTSRLGVFKENNGVARTDARIGKFLEEIDTALNAGQISKEEHTAYEAQLAEAWKRKGAEAAKAHNAMASAYAGMLMDRLKSVANGNAVQTTAEKAVSGVKSAKGLTEKQKPVFEHIKQAITENRADDVVDASGTWKYNEIAKALDIARGSAKAFIDGIAKRLADTQGVSVADMKQALRARAKDKRSVELSEFDKRGLSPAQQSSVFDEADLFGNEHGGEQSAGVIDTVGGSQGEVGENVAPPESNVQTAAELATEQRVKAEAEAAAATEIAQALKHPEYNNAAADWDDFKSDGAPKFQELTARAQAAWVYDYANALYEGDVMSAIANAQKTFEEALTPQDIANAWNESVASSQLPTFPNLAEDEQQWLLGATSEDTLQQRAEDIVKQRLEGQDEVLFRKGESKKGSLTKDQFQALLDRFVRKYPGASQLELVVLPDDSKFTAVGVHGVMGAYYAKSGKIEFVAANHANAAEAEETIRHELLGHFGLDMFRASDKRAILAYVRQAAQGNPELKAEYERELADASAIRLPEGATAEELAAAEVLSNLAERTGGTFQTILDGLRKLWNRALIAAGFRQKGYVTEAELRDQIRLAAYGLKHGYKQQNFPVSDNHQFRTASAAISATPYGRRTNTLVRQVFEQLGDQFQTVENALMFGHSLADKVTKFMPSAGKYFRTLASRQVERVRQEEEIAKIAAKAYELPMAEQVKLSKFLKESTMSGQWGFKPEWVPKAVVDQNSEAAKMYSELSADAKESAVAILKFGSEQQQRFDKAINDNIDDPAQKISRDQMYGVPYAPLKRFGDHVVIGKSEEYAAEQARLEAEGKSTSEALEKMQADAKHYYVEFVDSNWQAIQRRTELAEKNPSLTWNKKPLRLEDALLNSMNFTVLNRLGQQIEGMDANAKTKSALATLANQLYINQLNRLHANKTQQKRFNVAGADEDMLKAFVSHGRAEAALIANLRTHAETESALQAIKNAARKGDAQDRKARLMNEVLRRHLAMLNYKETPYQNAAMKLNSLYYLLTSPAYYLTNMTQPFVLSLPYMAATHGAGRSWETLRNAYKDAWGMVSLFRNNELDVSHLKKFDSVGKESEALKTLLDENIVNIGMQMELGDIVNRSSSPVMKQLDQAVGKLRGIAGNVETLNRLSSAAAAYRLAYTNALNRGKTAEEAHEAGTEYARKMLLDTHGDYSGYNAPSVMMHGAYGNIPVKLLTQFKKFSFIQAGLLVRFAKQAMAGGTVEERSAARAVLKWVLGTQFALAGALAIPGSGILASALAGAFGADGEDKEEYLRKLFGGGALAQLMLHGAPAAMHVDVSKRIGMGNVFDPFRMMDGSTGFSDWMLSMAGPSASLASRAYQGVKYMEKGQYWKGLENFLPNGIANVSKAARFESQGITNSRGDVVMQPSEVAFLAEVMQAIGLPTTSLTDRQWASNVLSDKTQYFKDEASKIKADYVSAHKAGEPTAGATQAWMKLQAARVAQGFARQPIAELRNAVKDQADREKNTVKGIQFVKANKKAAEALSDL